MWLLLEQNSKAFLIVMFIEVSQSWRNDNGYKILHLDNNFKSFRKLSEMNRKIKN